MRWPLCNRSARPALVRLRVAVRAPRAAPWRQRPGRPGRDGGLAVLAPVTASEPPRLAEGMGGVARSAGRISRASPETAAPQERDATRHGGPAAARSAEEPITSRDPKNRSHPSQPICTGAEITATISGIPGSRYICRDEYVDKSGTDPVFSGFGKTAGSTSETINGANGIPCDDARGCPACGDGLGAGSLARSLPRRLLACRLLARFMVLRAGTDVWP